MKAKALSFSDISLTLPLKQIRCRRKPSIDRSHPRKAEISVSRGEQDEKMEGVGSRLGRASSRYGPSATATVFNGPVRKWKKKWVHVPPPSSTVSHHNSNSHSQSNGHANNTTNSRLLLCRWTPLSPADATSEEPPKRKFRYTPIVVLEEEQRKAAKQVDREAKTDGTNQFTALHPSKSDKLNSDAALKTEIQDSKTSNLDLDLCLKGHNGDPDSVGQTKESQVKKASSGGFWTTG